MKVLRKNVCLILSSILACGYLAAKAEKAANLAIDGVTVLDVDGKSSLRQETKEQLDDRMRWWREAKFGMFIHWGIYAVPAGVYGNRNDHGAWIMYREKISLNEYEGYATQFNPKSYDPEAWVRYAKNAGMKYIVITAKHHDGFALFPSGASDWNVVDSTPYGKDLLEPLVKAAHGAGLKIGFYYSQAQDWYHVGGGKSRLKESEGWDPAHIGSFDSYLEEVAEPQIREILENYPIDIMWWDSPVLMNQKRGLKLGAAVLEVRPDIITNNRIGGVKLGGDIYTAEQFVPASGFPGDWETCMTMNNHWGYCAADDQWKSTTTLIHKLIEITSKGGNLLLNVGPTADGIIPAPSVDRLKAVGAWLDLYGDAVYATTKSPFDYLSWGAATRKNDRIYLFVNDWPQNGELRVPLTSPIRQASLLGNSAHPLKTRSTVDRLIIEVPKTAPNQHSSVIELQLVGEPVTAPILVPVASVEANSSLEKQPAVLAADRNSKTHWEAGVVNGPIKLDYHLEESTVIHAYSLDEPDLWPRYHQDIRMEVKTTNGWKTIMEKSTHGHGYEAVVEPVKTDHVRLHVSCENRRPVIADLYLYRPE
ncbi:MAG: alpha-L-fucosidase [Puniceicoccaceae bacterium]